MLGKLNALSKELTSASEQKASWLEFQFALSQAFPVDPRIKELKEKGVSKVDPKKIPFRDREDMYVDYIESKFVKDIKKWQDFIEPFHQKMRIDFTEEVSKEIDAANGEDDNATNDAVADSDAEPTSGWVIEVKAHHFHNSTNAMRNLKAGKQYVLHTLIEALLSKNDVQLPDHPGLDFTYSDLGVSHPTISWVSQSIKKDRISFDPSNTGGSSSRGNAGGFNDQVTDEVDEENMFDVELYAFVVQMAWVPRSEEEILAARDARLEAEKAAMEAKQASEEES